MALPASGVYVPFVAVVGMVGVGTTCRAFKAFKCCVGCSMVEQEAHALY